MQTYSLRARRVLLSFAVVAASGCLGAIGCSSSTSSAGDDSSGAAGDDSSGTSGTGTGTTTGAGGATQNGAGGAASGAGGQGSGGKAFGSGGTSATGGSAGQSGGGAGMMVAGTDAGRPMRTGPLRIMPIGDSITMATCYRARLAEILDKKHKGDYDFVGTQKNGGCNIVDQDNEGHGGYLVTQHTSEFASWAAANKVDVMLLHFATNDCWNSISPTKILAAYTTLVTEFRKKSPNAVFLAAQLIPLTPTGCDPCPNNVKTFNAAIPAWAAMTTTAQSPVIVVDEWTGYDSATDNRDGVHPNDTTGSTKMAEKWDDALEPLF
jgi:hypothetical protein